MKADASLLIRAAQTGDPAALEQLIAHCYPDLRRYAQKHCHASHAEDAIQETLLIATRNIHSLRQLHSWLAWMVTILKRQCHYLFRKFNIDIHLTDAEWSEFIAETPAPTLKLELIAALESLPSHYLEIILLRDFEELSIAEIAEQLHEKIPAIKSRLHRARTLVREYLLSEISLTN
ncbi:RNA polymerase sigma factor [Cellvibrio sp. KY-GH-1]|uniref:RNA polymerase sigma factor n=1 Tax=Cellvibrio sp. KY-GH-1 TaxID=2303332 RepID=UPI001CD92E05|nr:RNA polymerase sigma factor [Cellvibrio sp. KY-GH-1]